jgi:phosphatidylglycerophosphatase C
VSIDLPPCVAVSTVVAAFDVDGTVTTRDCVVPFLRRVAGTAAMAGRLATRSHRLLPALARRDRDALKAEATRAIFTGRPIAEVDDVATTFAEHVAGDWLRQDTVERIRFHAAAGHRVAFVSASYGVYLRPLAERLGVDGVVATELEVDVDGRCTGELVDGNCRGPEKARRLLAWLDANHGGRDAVELWAYGDSPGDRELLAAADRPVWV